MRSERETNGVLRAQAATARAAATAMAEAAEAQKRRGDMLAVRAEMLATRISGWPDAVVADDGAAQAKGG